MYLYEKLFVNLIGRLNPRRYAGSKIIIKDVKSNFNCFSIMKNKKILLGGAALGLLALISSCSTSSRTVYRDDVYNNRDAGQVYQSPDYYYTDGTAEGTTTDAEYYADDYTDEAYAEGGYEPLNDLEYANRINRFYYNSPGMMYYDPWFDPWYGYSGFGFGWNSGWGWSMGFGWGSPYWSMGWGSPYYGYGYGGWPYYGGYWGYNSYYSHWGNPYYGLGYGGGYYNNYYNSNRRVASNRNDVAARQRANSGRSYVTRDASGRYVTGRAASTRNTVNRTGSDRNSGRVDRGSTIDRTSSGRTNTSRSQGTIDRTGSDRNRGTISRNPATRSQGTIERNPATRSQGTINRAPSSRTPSSRNQGSVRETPSRSSGSFDRGSSSSRPSSSNGGFSRGSSGGSSMGTSGGGGSRSSGGSSRASGGSRR